MISVVIANFNRKEYLRNCLKSLQTQTVSPLEIIVVDNASSDGSVQMVENEFPNINLIRNNANCYLAAAYNQGITYSRAEFILCLNNDVILDRHFIEKIIKGFNLAEDTGVLTGLILRINNEAIIDSTGQFLSRSRRPLDRGSGQYLKKKFMVEGYVFGGSGSAVVYRRKMLEQIKIGDEYFDEDFKLFYEDLDLNWRANRFGWKAYYIPEAVAYHLRGGTIKTEWPYPRFLNKFYFSYLSADYQKIYIRNRYLTIIKNDCFKNYLKDFIFIFCFDLSLFFYALLFRPCILNVFLDILKYSKSAIKKRKIIFENLKGRNDL